ncbi:hypothetical protein [Urbifossiella limnaea]|uniref:Uncharacterized protein n=1 Tax=Urbifossiella limnaea TaxID=2528023 RepID=A0A517XZ42_9BACT|nr:hypothetical protein [Urbifossiella limnaea]QDU22780.1 hypothetical protein ETAA1_47680 [Urbifossiella limnaea]
MTALFADVAVWPVYVVLGGMVVAGVFGAAGIAWLGYWLVRRSRTTFTRVEEDGP